jgi:hypothetical protein
MCVAHITELMCFRLLKMGNTLFVSNHRNDKKNVKTGQVQNRIPGINLCQRGS